jgi:hypothetical protein
MPAPRSNRWRRGSLANTQSEKNSHNQQRER